MQKVGRLHVLCQEREDYRELWDSGNHLARVDAQPAEPQQGPGTQLHKLLGKLGLESAPGCKCNERLVLMNQWGVAKCRENLATITGWLREEADKRGLPFVELAAKAMVKLAIRRAERAGK